MFASSEVVFVLGSALDAFAAGCADDAAKRGFASAVTRVVDGAPRVSSFMALAAP